MKTKYAARSDTENGSFAKANYKVGRREGSVIEKTCFDQTRSGAGTRLGRKLKIKLGLPTELSLIQIIKKEGKDMTQIKIGIDNGNYDTKSSDRMQYASGFAVSDREFITSEMQLFYEGTYYAIGGKRMNFQQEKTKQEDTFILTLPAIANAMKSKGVSTAEITLGVGLPIDIYGAQKEAFGQYFLRDDICFRFEEADYHCCIAECKVFAQGHAALCKYYPQLKELRSITLVDIGGYTLDVLTLHDFKVDRSSCASLRMGTITLFNSIRDELQQENIILSDALIADAMQGWIQHAETC